MPKRDLLTDERIDHPTQHRVFRFGALPGLLARFGIGNEFRFADKFKIDGQRNVLAVGQSRQQVDSLNVPILGMVEVSADQFVSIRSRRCRVFLPRCHQVIKDQAAILRLYRADVRLDDFPQIFAVKLILGEKARHLVMAHDLGEKCRESRGGCLPKGNEQIVR